ncbi:MAG: C10 family peptidase [Muribaculaceae bacterium]|nr:C10 family peptidase [Muribaculaceae bacterium]
MKRLMTFTALSTLLWAGVSAAPISPETALSRLQNQDTTIPATRAGSAELKFTMRTPDGSPSLYVFRQAGEGFMILSADDVAAPLLGYSDTGTFDPDNIPPALQSWLNGYQEQIEYMRLNDINETFEESTRASLPNWSGVGPLVKTTWDQNEPYDELCPKIGNVTCPTGCVATAMAQVMNYFKYPEKGQGSISYISEGSQNLQLEMDFSATTFDWDNMLNNYESNVNYPANQVTAVATLMKAAGYAVRMNYNTGQSGAVSGYIPGALITYFGYDPSAMFVSRNQKTYTEWATLIYNNLKNVGPVIYDGDTATSGGHSFVCDGYSNGFFHFNWGWAGVSDGYYRLDALNPTALGTGGAAGGFNFRQDAVVNIRKPQSGIQPAPEQVVLSGSIYGTTSQAYLYMRINGSNYPGFRYYGDSEITFTVGAQIVEADNANATPQYIPVTNDTYLGNYLLDPGYVCYCDGTGRYPFPMFKLSSLDLKDNVKYKVTCAYLPVGGEWQIAEASVGCFNYFYITKTSSGYVFDNKEVLEFDCTELVSEEQLYDRIAGQFKLTIKNNTDTELTRGVTLLLLDSPETNANVVYQSDSFVQTLEPGESFSTNWTTQLQSETTLRARTNFYPALYDIDTDMIYYLSNEPWQMLTYPGAPKYNVTVEIENAELVNKVYQVANAQDFIVNTNLYVTQGIFSESLNLWVATLENGRYYYDLIYPLDLKILNGGDQTTYTTHVNFPAAEIGKKYSILIYSAQTGSYIGKPIDFVTLTNAIDDLKAPEQENSVTVFNLQGVKLLDKADKSALSSLAPGLYIVNGKKVYLK